MDYIFKPEELQIISNMIEEIPWKHAQPLMDYLKAIVQRNNQENAKKVQDAKDLAESVNGKK